MPTTEDLRALDAAIARRLFGQLLGEEIWTDKPGVVRIGGADAYSTDIAKAFDVVEAMRERGWLLSLTDDGLPSGETWLAEFVRGNQFYYDPFTGRASTPQEAIARAALAALGGES